MPGILDVLAAQGLLNVFNRPQGNRRPTPNATDTGDETARLMARTASPGVRTPNAAPAQAMMPQGPQGQPVVPPSVAASNPVLAQAMSGASFEDPDTALAMQQASQGPMPNMPDPYASSPLSQQAALDTAMREEKGKTDWAGILNAIGQGLVIAGSPDPLKALTQVSELDKAEKDSKKPKITPVQGGAFSMIQYPGGRTEFVRNDQVAQFIEETSGRKLMEKILLANVNAQAGVTAAAQKAAAGEQVRGAGDAASTALNVDELTRIQNELAKTDTASGPVIGNLPKFVRDTIFPEGTSLQDSAERIIQGSLRQTLGAQFTQTEGANFLARAYNPRVSEAENARRLGVVIEELKTIQNNKDAALEYMRKNGSLQGFMGVGAGASPSAPAAPTATTPAPSNVLPKAGKYF